MKLTMTGRWANFLFLCLHLIFSFYNSLSPSAADPCATLAFTILTVLTLPCLALPRPWTCCSDAVVGPMNRDSQILLRDLPSVLTQRGEGDSLQHRTIVSSFGACVPALCGELTLSFSSWTPTILELLNWRKKFIIHCCMMLMVIGPCRDMIV